MGEARTTAPTVPGHTRATAADASAPREELGPYLIYERLGIGGMATVDRAIERGLEGLERNVALKRLLPHLSCDESVVRSFVREARLAAQLQHANIAQTFMLGRVGTIYFIAMEYVEGCSLHYILRHTRLAGPPPISVAIAIVRQVCDALEYAHERNDTEGRPLGLVHRDVSPTNLLISRSGHVKVIDFGIAQSVQLRSETRRIKGKLAYMSPEAIEGERLDQRSDLFSLGVVLYELLTARPLFGHHTDLELDRDTIRPPTSVRDDLPVALDAIVMRALSTDPADRWPSAAAFRSALLAVSQEVATPSDIAAWCEPAFDFERSGPIEVRNVVGEPATSTDHDERRRASSSGIVLDDVPDYAELSIIARPETSPSIAAFRAVKWTHLETIETHTVPPPSRTATGSRPPSTSRTSDRAGERTSVSAKPVAANRSLPLVRRLRLDLRIALGAAGGATIGIAILLLTRGGSKRPQDTPALAASPPLVVVAAVPTTGTLSFEVTPSDATIVVGDLPPRASTPFTLDLPSGVYTIAISAPEHDAWSTSLTVKAGESQLVRTALASNKAPPLATATIAIDSTPAGLDVILDGTLLTNKTPIRMGVVPGAHAIVVRDAAGEVWSTKFVARDNLSHRFTAARPLPEPRRRHVAPTTTNPPASADEPPADTNPPTPPPPIDEHTPP